MEEVFYTFNICIISLINLEILHCMIHMLWWVLVNLTGKILCYRMRNIRFKPCKKKKKIYIYIYIYKKKQKKTN